MRLGFKILTVIIAIIMVSAGGLFASLRYFEENHDTTAETHNITGMITIKVMGNESLSRVFYINKSMDCTQQEANHELGYAFGLLTGICKTHNVSYPNPIDSILFGFLQHKFTTIAPDIEARDAVIDLSILALIENGWTVQEEE